MKNNQKCVRLSDRVTKYIEAYRGGNFSEKLENLVLDMEENMSSWSWTGTGSRRRSVTSMRRCARFRSASGGCGTWTFAWAR